MNKDKLTLLAGFLGALKLFLSSIGYDIIEQDMIDAFVNLVGFGFALYAAYKNTYVTPHGKKQKEALKDKGLM